MIKTVERKEVCVCVCVCACVPLVRLSVPTQRNPPTRTHTHQPCPLAQCSQCKKDKPSPEFNLDKDTRGGLRSSCMVCVREAGKEKREAGKE
jgi:hypothetical protein